MAQAQGTCPRAAWDLEGGVEGGEDVRTRQFSVIPRRAKGHGRSCAAARSLQQPTIRSSSATDTALLPCLATPHLLTLTPVTPTGTGPPRPHLANPGVGRQVAGSSKLLILPPCFPLLPFSARLASPHAGGLRSAYCISPSQGPASTCGTPGKGQATSKSHSRPFCLLSQGSPRSISRCHHRHRHPSYPRPP
jgi:hypothetical protein